MSGGIIEGPARKYRLDGTLDLTTHVALDFGCNGNGGDSVGAILYGTVNAPILRYSGQNRFVRLSGLSVLGNNSGPNQHGVVVENGGIWMENVTIRACGGDGVRVLHSYCGHYRNLYISHCGGHGVQASGSVGANFWQHIISCANGGDGLRIEGIDGADQFMSLITEQNGGHGTRIEGATKHC